MKPDIDITEQFVTLVWQPCHDPDTTDRDALLRAASDFLDSIGKATGDLAASARKMAYGAMNWGFYVGSHDKMRRPWNGK